MLQTLSTIFPALSLGPLSFLTPLAFVLLPALPLLWWLLRLLPPPPRRIAFPAVGLLFGLQAEDKAAATTPWWLLVLRLLMILLLIAALSYPVYTPRSAGEIASDGPMMLVIDDSWAAARDWRQRERAATHLLREADRMNRPVYLLRTARSATPPPAIQPMTAQAALTEIRQMQPKPWDTDLVPLSEALRAFTPPEPVEVFWIEDGLQDLPAGSRARFLDRLRNLGSLDLIAPPAPSRGGIPPRLLLAPEREGVQVAVPALRAGPPSSHSQSAPELPAETLTVEAVNRNGLTVAREPLRFEQNAFKGRAVFSLPPDLINDLQMFRLAPPPGENRTVGHLSLLDDRLRFRPVGIASGNPLRADLPLLSDTYFIGKALGPKTQLFQGSLAEMLDRELSVLIVTDGVLGPATDAARRFVENGGVLVRFAGPRLAAAAVRQELDPLLPVELRAASREIGGSLSWSDPMRLAGFADQGPFTGIAIPDDVQITSQVLAEPSAALSEATWASLEDGTPLVTGRREGSGWLVLFHTTANNDWSDLPLSGVFVDMLSRLVDLSQGVRQARTRRPAEPALAFDGFGNSLSAFADDLLVRAKPLDPDTGEAGAAPPEGGPVSLPGPLHPPGYYGDTADGNRTTVNMYQAYVDAAAATGPQSAEASAPSRFAPAPLVPSGVGYRTFDQIEARIDLRPWLLTAALALFVIEFLVTLFYRGVLRGSRNPGLASGAAAVLLAIVLSITPVRPLFAQTTDDAGDPVSDPAADFVFAEEVALDTHLAFVVTGVPAVDRASADGLANLAQALSRRTNVKVEKPIALDLETRSPLFFPVIYWPVTAAQPPLSEESRARVNAYLKRGGLILFDSRDAYRRPSTPGAASINPSLQRLTEGLSIPPLQPIPPDHVLTRAYYLLQEFPGKFTGGSLWVSEGADINDGVSPVVIGSHDWASAWAEDRAGRGTPQPEDRQRELAYRFGINLVMYALTGNYKADQVHLPAIMQRLSQ